MVRCLHIPPRSRRSNGAHLQDGNSAARDPSHQDHQCLPVVSTNFRGSVACASRGCADVSLPPEAWRSVRLLRAVPNCRLLLILAYHLVSPALSIEEAGLMTYLQAPLDAGPSVSQATTGLQNWKCTGRRLVQIGGRLPTANQLHQSFVKILSKHLAANKKASFAFQQKSSTMPMMNPSPTEIVELSTLVEVTLILATIAGRFPGVAAASAKAKRNKVEVAVEEQPKEEPQAHAIAPRPKNKGQSRGSPPTSPPKNSSCTCIVARGCCIGTSGQVCLRHLRLGHFRIATWKKLPYLIVLPATEGCHNATIIGSSTSLCSEGE